MKEQISTNIRMPVELHKKAKEYAMRNGISLAEVVREAVGEYVTETEPKLRAEEVARDPFFAVIGIGESSDDVAAHGKDHDDTLYGDGK